MKNYDLWGLKPASLNLKIACKSLKGRGVNSGLRLIYGLLKKMLTQKNCEVSGEILQLVDNTYNQTGTTIEESQALTGQMHNEIIPAKMETLLIPGLSCSPSF